MPDTRIDRQIFRLNSRIFCLFACSVQALGQAVPQDSVRQTLGWVEPVNLDCRIYAVRADFEEDMASLKSGESRVRRFAAIVASRDAKVRELMRSVSHLRFSALSTSDLIAGSWAWEILKKYAECERWCIEAASRSPDVFAPIRFRQIRAVAPLHGAIEAGVLLDRAIAANPGNQNLQRGHVMVAGLLTNERAFVRAAERYGRLHELLCEKALEDPVLHGRTLTRSLPIFKGFCDRAGVDSRQCARLMAVADHLDLRAAARRENEAHTLDKDVVAEIGFEVDMLSFLAHARSWPTITKRLRELTDYWLAEGESQLATNAVIGLLTYCRKRLVPVTDRSELRRLVYDRDAVFNDVAALSPACRDQVQLLMDRAQDRLDSVSDTSAAP